MFFYGRARVRGPVRGMNLPPATKEGTPRRSHQLPQIRGRKGKRVAVNLKNYQQSHVKK